LTNYSTPHSNTRRPCAERQMPACLAGQCPGGNVEKFNSFKIKIKR
jgi:hypothetical protein